VTLRVGIAIPELILQSLIAGISFDVSDAKKCETSVYKNRSYALVTCEIKSFQNYFRGLLQLTNIFSNTFYVTGIILK